MDESAPRLPYWLRAGLAQFYSTLKPGDNSMKLGGPPTRSYHVRSTNQVDMNLLVGVDKAAYLASRSKGAQDFGAAWADQPSVRRLPTSCQPAPLVAPRPRVRGRRAEADDLRMRACGDSGRRMNSVMACLTLANLARLSGDGRACAGFGEKAQARRFDAAFAVFADDFRVQACGYAHRCQGIAIA